MDLQEFKNLPIKNLVFEIFKDLGGELSKYEIFAEKDFPNIENLIEILDQSFKNKIPVLNNKILFCWEENNEGNSDGDSIQKIYSLTFNADRNAIRYFSIDGYYSSYGDNEYDTEISEVMLVQITKTEYIKKE